MRPIKLTMTAFGAYAKKTVLEFDKLGTQGLYLITGDTGSGKTTIFDAISFALFGGPSGEFRDSEMIRSRYADDKTNTVVELDFDYLGKRYKINRTLKSDNKKTVRLEFPDGKLFEKITDVKREIEELLGINQNQFKQIVMLAQGDFRRMLFSNTEERRKIFRKIFGTDIYEQFEDKIKEKARESKNNFKSAKSEVLVRISNVKCNENEELAMLRQSISENELPNLSTLEEFCGLLRTQNARDLEQNKLLAEKIGEAHEKWSRLSTEITEEKNNYTLFSDLKRLRETLPALEKLALENKAFAEETESANLPKIDALKKQITLIETTLGEYKRLEESVNDLNELKRRLAQETAEHDKLGKTRVDLSAKLNALKAESETLKSAGENLANLNAEKEKAERRKNDVSTLLKDVSELEKKKSICDKAKEEYGKAREEAEKISEDAKRLRRRFNDEQAGIIAEALIDGEPCPVCGSVHHPSKAVKSENAPTQAEVEKAEELAKSAAAAENSASLESGAARGAYNEAKSAVAGSIERLRLNCVLEGAKDAAADELEKIGNLLAGITKALELELSNNKRREELEKKIPEHTKTLDDLNTKINELEKQIAADNTAAVEKSRIITEQKEKLTFGNESAAMSEIGRLKSNADVLDREMKNAKEKVEQSVKELYGARTEADTIAKRLPQDYTPADLDEKTAQLYALDINEKELARSAKEIEFRLSGNADILKTLSGSISKLQKQEEEYNTIERLSNVANGKSKFETFVQTEFFRDILRNANIHFRRMSNDQYELVRKEVPEDKMRDHTLDLNIRDYYNGTTRDVRSLSGGESFIASLSLALGLSETIQQKSGGVKLETMFVDEGFGSLDDETLQQAMKALTSLTESNRLIGIISHVDAVKRDISKKIIVKKDGANGSTAEIIA